MTQAKTESYAATQTFAAALAKSLPKGTVIAFLGDLGAGKTAFTAGFVKGLGIDAEVASPTFAICNVYRGTNDTVYHYDMYRVNTWEDLYSTGFLDINEPEAYVLVEWSENIFGALPEDALIIRIDKLSETERLLTLMTKEEAEHENLGN